MNPATITILNVDDNEGSRYAKTRILKLAGYQVLEAATGGDALSCVKEKLPHLVLLDVKLPDINGLEVCRLIKNDPATAAVLVLQTSAHMIARADKVRALESGADNYLVAPIEAEELIANVHALLRLRKVRDELMESEERFRQMAENIGDVFWIFSPDEMKLLYVSPAYEKIWGQSVESLHDNFLSWLDSVHEEDKPRVNNAFQRLLENQRYEEEFRIVHPDGTLQWVSDRGFPVRNGADDFYRIARITSDITTRKAVEHILRESDRRKDEFLATLAHELRNPLAPLSNALEILQRPDITPALQEHARAIMARQVTQMARLIDELLDISRISCGKIELQKQTVPLKDVVDNAIEIARPVIDQRRHTLIAKLPDEPVYLDVDKTRAAQILSNLLNNAAKYTESGGTIVIQVDVLKRSVNIKVRDNGIGIAADMLPKIFDMFTQANRSFDQSQGGLGVGLSLAKRLVELHGGSLTAFSEGLGKGSEFTVSLPYVSNKKLSSETSAETAKPEQNRRRRVLVVDDNVDSAESLADILRLDGHEVFSAYDGLEALRLVESKLPNIVFLDIGLPKLDGYETARRIRQLPQGRGISLVAVSGWGQQKDLAQSKAAGFDSHLVKPADAAALRELIGRSPLAADAELPPAVNRGSMPETASGGYELSSLPPAGHPSAQESGTDILRKILIVDDSSAMQDSVAYLLKRDGFSIRTASDGLEALEVARAWLPDFVFLDIRMPQLDGFEVARRLRAEFNSSEMKLILMSGLKLDTVLVRRAKRMGFDECIDKISPPQEWYRLIDEASQPDSVS